MLQAGHYVNWDQEQVLDSCMCLHTKCILEFCDKPQSTNGECGPLFFCLVSVSLLFIYILHCLHYFIELSSLTLNFAWGVCLSLVSILKIC